jgi:predicted CXXCH cytochrome family protein
MLVRQRGRFEIFTEHAKRISRNPYYRFIVSIIITFLASPSIARIQGSAHDFTSYGWSSGEVCDLCHIPDNHNAQKSILPSWNRQTSPAAYTLFRHASLQLTPQQSDIENISRLCQSCHDGTIAPDKFGGNRIGNYITPRQSRDISLRNHHPINVQQGVAAGDADAMAHTSVKLFAGMVECASCHDVHNSQVADEKLLRVARAGSQLCFQCHKK